ncbi:hypothetical protein OIV83_000408 [Microbotryomycetes sp. JL201]|nr:hypothetical protein OIV83_000408 [Microbotryomycetes sp. JL201]
MAAVSPPGYTVAAAGVGTADGALADADSVALVNLVPAHGSASFLLGHLGYGPASLGGEVQVKWLSSPHAAVEQLKIVFRGVERGPSCPDSPIELVEHTQILWGIGAQSTSSSGTHLSLDGTGQLAKDAPAASTAFKLELTPDLPHCIHTGPSPDSSLEYTLTAVLTFSDATVTQPITHSVPVHLARTLPPGALASDKALAAATSLGNTSDMSSDTSPAPSVLPQIHTVNEPVPLSIRLAKTVFTRSEPVELAVKVHVPSAEVVQKEGLRLRTISAELVRKIAAVHVEDDKPSPESHYDEIQEADDSAVPTLPNDVPPHVTVLARSGKSARFSLTRPIVIRLLLHPPRNPSCESVSQSTILHNISFEVRVTIGLIATTTRDQHQNRDSIVSRTIHIVPDYPASRSDKQKEVDRDASPDGFSPTWLAQDGPVPTYFESTSSMNDGGGSWTPQPPPVSPLVPGTSAGLSPPAHSNADSTFEEEYDGYEDISASLSNLAPPPAIDEDVSPPSPGAVGTFASISDLITVDRAESSIRLDDDPPPESEYDTDGAVGNSLRFIPIGTTSSPSIPSSPSSLIAFTTSAESSTDPTPLLSQPMYSAESSSNRDPRESDVGGQSRSSTTTDPVLPPPYAGRADNDSLTLAARRSRREIRVSSTNAFNENDARGSSTAMREPSLAQSDNVDEDEEAVGPPPEYSTHGHHGSTSG